MKNLLIGCLFLLNSSFLIAVTTRSGKGEDVQPRPSIRATTPLSSNTDNHTLIIERRYYDVQRKGENSDLLQAKKLFFNAGTVALSTLAGLGAWTLWDMIYDFYDSAHCVE